MVFSKACNTWANSDGRYTVGRQFRPSFLTAGNIGRQGGPTLGPTAVKRYQVKERIFNYLFVVICLFLSSRDFRRNFGCKHNDKL